MSKIQDTGYRIKKSGYKIQDARFRITDKKTIMHRVSCIMHRKSRASCIVHRDNNGFTLIEIIMIIVVVSIAIPALLILVGGEAQRGIEPELRITATNVAQQLMDEMMTKCWDETAISGGACTGTVSYSDLGIDTGETPGTLSTYDDVDDYDAGVPAVTVSGVSYSRSVQVCYVPDSNLNKTSPCDKLLGTGTNYKRIAVTVTAPSTNWNSSVVLTTVMTNY